MSITKENQEVIIDAKLAQYEQRYFSLTLDMEIAEHVGNKRLVEQIMENAKEVKKAMKLLKDKKAEME